MKIHFNDVIIVSFENQDNCSRLFVCFSRCSSLKKTYFIDDLFLKEDKIEHSVFSIVRFMEKFSMALFSVFTMETNEIQIVNNEVNETRAVSSTHWIKTHVVGFVYATLLTMELKASKLKSIHEFF